MTVKEVDFGKDKNEARRTLCRLLGLLEAQEAELRDDPTRLFNMAGAEIARLQKTLRMADDAIARLQKTLRMADDATRPLVQYMPDAGPPMLDPDLEPIRVPRGEYRRLKLCADIVQNWRDFK